jgi:hypothetical protein
VTLDGTFALASGTVTTNHVVGTGAVDITGGTLTIDHARVGSLSVSNATVTVRPNGTADGMSILDTLTLGTAGKLQLNDNDLIVHYSGASPESEIRQLVMDGMVAGSTRGIFSTLTSDAVFAIADSSEWGESDFNGVAIDDTTIVGKYTYYGDANLDGKVTSDDYVAVDVGIGSGDSWVQGDFNFSESVTSDDYVAIDVNLGKGTPNPLAWAELKAEMIALHTEMFGADYLAKIAAAEAYGFAPVPEPAGAAIILGALGMMTRRRRR